LKYRQWTKYKKRLLQIITHHCQNPLDFIWINTTYSVENWLKGKGSANHKLNYVQNEINVSVDRYVLIISCCMCDFFYINFIANRNVRNCLTYKYSFECKKQRNGGKVLYWYSNSENWMTSIVTVSYNQNTHFLFLHYGVIQKEVYALKNLFYKYYWTYGNVLYIDWRENSQSYFHTLQALDMSPTCDAADVKSIIQLFPHSSQHVTGNSSHRLSVLFE
jgi:hypothetical protein